jgi:hypothetical protein
MVWRKCLADVGGDHRRHCDVHSHSQRVARVLEDSNRPSVRLRLDELAAIIRIRRQPPHFQYLFAVLVVSLVRHLHRLAVSPIHQMHAACDPVLHVGRVIHHHAVPEVDDVLPVCSTRCRKRQSISTLRDRVHARRLDRKRHSSCGSATNLVRLERPPRWRSFLF